MAQQVNVKFVDDLDGSDAAGTVSFAIDGRAYEIDLSEDNAARLRDSLASFVAAARKSGGTGAGGRSPGTEDDRELGSAAAAAGPGADRGDPGVGPAERPPGLRPRPDLEDGGGRLPGRPLTQDDTTREGPERKSSGPSSLLPNCWPLVLVAGRVEQYPHA